MDANPGDPAGTRPHANVTKPVMTGQQWVKGAKWPYECVVVSNLLAPTVPVEPLQPMKYRIGRRSPKTQKPAGPGRHCYRPPRRLERCDLWCSL